MLRSGLDRDRHFDRLWVGIEQRPYLARVIRAEHEDLERGDIPMFTTRPESCDIWSSSDERITDFFDESGLMLVRRRLQRLSDDDLVRQCWFIHASLATLPTKTVGNPIYRITEPERCADQEHLLNAARAVGDRLEMLALHNGEDVSWFGLSVTQQGKWSLTPLWVDFYDGLPGVTLFLAYLGAITGEERYTMLARTALTTLRREMQVTQSFITAIGAFDGWGGIIYTLVHLGTLWEQPELLTEAEAIVDLLSPLIERDERLDVVGGAAGCICSLLSLYRLKPSPRTLSIAALCGHQLVDRKQAMEHGSAWMTHIAATAPLTGFAHGAGGIAYALLELAALIGEERFKITAAEAIAYERSLFSPEMKNWPDLRSSAARKEGAPGFMTAWCFGAAGIGLARMHSLQHFDDDAIRWEINTALQTTLDQGFGFNHSLCHGDLGCAELLIQASERLTDSQWNSQVDRLASIILDSIAKYGWLCGTPQGVESPGLMTGLAGIGYGLLRLAEPSRVPSVLGLAPPKVKPDCSGGR
jgi:type 2 lantibiotic biosynthesis protein LanM